MRWIAVLVGALAWLPGRTLLAEPLELRDGERVALIGNAFIELEQHHSYLETLLRTRWPDRKITFRNLGWSADTVFGDSRGDYDGTRGLERLKRALTEIKPTVIFISYGTVESFDGEAGLSRFRQGLHALLDMLQPLGARTILIGPMRHENLGPPLPDPSVHNRELRRYADAMADVARERKHRFIDLIDLFESLGDEGEPLTHNGLHLTQYGYWRAAGAIAAALELAPGAQTLGPGTVKQLRPAPPPPRESPRRSLPGWERFFIAKDLEPGDYVLKANGKPIAAGSAQQWANGIEIVDDPLSQRAEQARALAIQKNIQFFNQYRPANEPYIFGFRKAEQSRNRLEIPRFDEPIGRLEAQITQLSQPMEITYTIEPSP